MCGYFSTGSEQIPWGECGKETGRIHCGTKISKSKGMCRRLQWGCSDLRWRQWAMQTRLRQRQALPSGVSRQVWVRTGSTCSSSGWHSRGGDSCRVSWTFKALWVFPCGHSSETSRSLLCPQKVHLLPFVHQKHKIAPSLLSPTLASVTSAAARVKLASLFHRSQGFQKTFESLNKDLNGSTNMQAECNLSCREITQRWALTD